MRARVAPAAALDVLAVWIVALPGCLALLAGRLVGTHDGYFHLYRFFELERAVRAGDLYPRWAPDMALGYGYPVFNYYSPLALYLALPWRLVGAGLIASLGLGQAASVLMAGAAMYLLARGMFGRAAGVLAGCLYATLPYLLVDVYVRGAIAETLALALLPLVAWTLRRLMLAPGPAAIAAAAVAVAALTLAHNITALVGLPVLGMLALLELRAVPRALWAGRIAAAALAGVLGLALSAVYWLPALLESGLVHNELLTTLFYDFHNHFQPAAEVVQHTPAFSYNYDAFSGFLFRAGLVQVAAAAIGAVVGLARLRDRRAPLAFLAVVAVSGLFLMTSASARLWESLPLLAFAQFPWRMLSLVGFASVLLTASLVAGTRGRARAVVALVVLLPWLLASYVELRPALLDLREDEVSRGALNRIELDRKLIATTTIGEYLPRTSPADLFAGWQAPLPAPERPAHAVDAEATGADGVAVDVDVGGTLVLDVLDFPGWQATADGAPLAVRPLGDRGLIAVDVPDGARRVTVTLGSTPIRTGGAVASAGALVALLVLLALRWRRRALVVAALLLVVPLVRAPSAVAAASFPPSSFEGGPRLLGGRDLGAGQIELFWTTEAPVGRSLDVALRLLDERGQVVARRDKAPRYGVRPTDGWRPGVVVHDAADLAPPQPLTGGSYRLAVGLHDDAGYLAPRDGAVVRWSESCPCAGPGEGIGVVVATIGAPPAVPAPPPFLSATRQLPLATHPIAGERIELTDVRIDVAREALTLVERIGGALARRLPPLRRVFAATEPDTSALGGPGGVLATLDRGGTFVVEPTWRALADVDEDYAVSIQLVDNKQRLFAQDDEWPRRGFSPTTQWHTGQVTADGFRVKIPLDGLPGAYGVALHLYRRADFKRLTWSGDPPGRDQVALGRVKVRPPPVDDPRPALAVFGGAIELLSAAEPAEAASVRAGTTIHVRPTWRSRQLVDRDLTAFVHLLNADGKLVANGDSPPLGGRYPTSLWEPGEVIADDYAVAIPADLRGPATLEVGLYRPDNGERLRTADADSVVLAALTVTP